MSAHRQAQLLAGPQVARGDEVVPRLREVRVLRAAAKLADSVPIVVRRAGSRCPLCAWLLLTLAGSALGRDGSLRLSMNLELDPVQDIGMDEAVAQHRLVGTLMRGWVLRRGCGPRV